MGAWVSDNYDQITPCFNVNYWKVHSAVKKSTQEKVCLWQLDIETLKSKVKSQATIDTYVKNCLSGLQMQKRLLHPHILKILEINEQSPALSFASEPVETCITLDTRLSRDEILYLAKQLCETLEFLHNSAKIAHLCLSPDSLCLTSDFSVKLTNFTWACQIAEDEKSVLVLKPSSSPLNVPSSFMSPEQFNSKNVTLKSDVFSFSSLICSLIAGRTIYECPNINTDSLIPRTIEDDTREALAACFDDDPNDRPSFSELKKCTGICVVTTQVYTYIDNAFSKSPQDKFAFLKGLFKIIPNLSVRLMNKKIIPFLIDELEHDVRFSPAVVPLLINIGHKIGQNQFMTTIFPIISKYFSVTNPIELPLALFSCFEILLELIPPEMHFDVIYPVFKASLDNGNKRLRIESVKNIPKFIEILSENGNSDRKLINDIFERLVVSLGTPNEMDNDTLTLIVRSIKFMTKNIENEYISRKTFNLIGQRYLEYPSKECSEEILSLLMSNKMSIEDILKYSVPLASIVISDKRSSQEVILTLCKFVSRVISKRQDEIAQMPKSNNDDNEDANDGDDKVEAERPVVIKPKNANKRILTRKNSKQINTDTPSVDAKPQISDQNDDEILEELDDIQEKKKQTKVNEEDEAVNEIVTVPSKKDRKPKLKTKY
ncbi:TKL family protein kinase [Trichomonas vaginalis G3]|uniref:TKL family protein kinase n=1 Tax=Trichomonas vaginalis (strain ATCC PRA-98 / G3) TaxID=412133 RepID=A2DAD3_TRIV3|nr:SCY1-related S/T protein kinase-like family [Trichomonas vaginalis G3]EAY22781.1 TKL family protein kinase [Trichomonas vaginalis G3]KAI5525592.1 SCY1-related S/T protein kinase-like family [Trichomonas vaginalis G3]|eukprot:XP_001583767.1 TKL family protein kinase [Trichomonas vaginalis G3]